MFGIAGAFHAMWLAEMRGWVSRWTLLDGLVAVGVAIAFVAVSVPLLAWLTRLAIFLTATESRFWGMRLPPAVVRRAMNFHAANYLPIAALALLVTGGFRLGLATNLFSLANGVAYLITLCSLVVLSAIWLFESYVVAMKRIRLANF